ncbi:MAG: hydroxyacylglutathione hydrolase [Alphaproteobacteria bacterium]
MSKLEIYQFPTRSDNYGVLIHDSDTGATAAIDAPEAEPIIAALLDKGWTLSDILITHHHGDHTAGIDALKKKTSCTVYGPAREAGLIPGLDVEVGEGDEVTVGGAKGRLIDTPGHTRGHVSYHFPDNGAVFVGDTLFSVGCGKLLEGDAPTMWASLSKLAALPAETKVYCGHEYTGANCRFALTVEPDNAALQARAAEVAQNDAAGAPSLPTTISQELETNPFLRASSPEIQARLGMEGRPLDEIFGEVRARKDQF